LGLQDFAICSTFIRTVSGRLQPACTGISLFHESIGAFLFLREKTGVQDMTVTVMVPEDIFW
jgi:hypothetical protein